MAGLISPGFHDHRLLAKLHFFTFPTGIAPQDQENRPGVARKLQLQCVILSQHIVPPQVSVTISSLRTQNV